MNDSRMDASTARTRLGAFRIPVSLKLLGRACAALIGIALAVALVPHQSVASAECRELMASVASFGTGITSSAGSFRLETSPVDMEGLPPEQSVLPRSVVGTWVMSGVKFREEILVSYPTLGHSENIVLIYDGLSAAIVAPDARPSQTLTAVAQETQFDRWLGISHLYMPGSQLLRLPAEEHDPVIAGTDFVGDVECIRIDALQPYGGLYLSWWVAPQYGYMVMRRDSVHPGPCTDVAADQAVRVRTEVSEFVSFDDGIYLPTGVEMVCARTNSDGSVGRVYYRTTFTAENVTVNQPIDPSRFDVSHVLPGASAGPASAAATVDDPRFASAGCGFSALLDFARVMNATFDNDSVSDLVHLYQDRGISSFADIASDLEVILPLAVTGYNGSFQDLADLNQAAIVHLNTERGPHFAVVESISAGKVRIFDGGVMRIVLTDDLQAQFTGKLLTVEVERAPGQSIPLPRVLCPASIAPVPSAECEAPDQSAFSITNLGSAPLRLREMAVFPRGALNATTPAELQPGDTARVVVQPLRSVVLDDGWQLVLETNDPLRPLLWLSSGEIASSQEMATPS